MSFSARSLVAIRSGGGWSNLPNCGVGAVIAPYALGEKGLVRVNEWQVLKLRMGTRAA